MKGVMGRGAGSPPGKGGVNIKQTTLPKGGAQASTGTKKGKVFGS